MLINHYWCIPGYRICRSTDSALVYYFLTWQGWSRESSPCHFGPHSECDGNSQQRPRERKVSKQPYADLERGREFTLICNMHDLQPRVAHLSQFLTTVSDTLWMIWHYLRKWAWQLLELICWEDFWLSSIKNLCVKAKDVCKLNSMRAEVLVALYIYVSELINRKGHLFLQWGLHNTTPFTDLIQKYQPWVVAMWKPLTLYCCAAICTMLLGDMTRWWDAKATCKIEGLCISISQIHASLITKAYVFLGNVMLNKIGLWVLNRSS